MDNRKRIKTFSQFHQHFTSSFRPHSFAKKLQNTNSDDRKTVKKTSIQKGGRKMLIKLTPEDVCNIVAGIDGGRSAQMANYSDELVSVFFLRLGT